MPPPPPGSRTGETFVWHGRGREAGSQLREAGKAAGPVFSRALSGLVPNSPPPSAARNRDSLAFDQHEEGTPVGRGGLRAAKKPRTHPSPGSCVPGSPTGPASHCWSSVLPLGRLGGHSGVIVPSGLRVRQTSVFVATQLCDLEQVPYFPEPLFPPPVKWVYLSELG